MKMQDATEEMRALETRYHELHRIAQSARLMLTIAMGSGDDDCRWGVQRRLDEVEREKKEIIRKVALIEDSLVEEDC